MTPTNNNVNSRKALIHLIIGLIYPLLSLIFVLLGTYLKHQSDCVNVEFMLCTGANGFLAGIYNNLILITIFGAVIFLPITILALSLAVFFYLKSKK